jgi:NAD(P)-dependent dehydrogenase (short-subunit alcohol dehydrogenase family)
MPGRPGTRGARRRSTTVTERDDSVHVVFGATGALGRAVVIELLRAGRDVRAVSRGGQAPDGAQGVAADAADPAQAARAAAGAAVLYHCASPPYARWPGLFPALTGSILGAAESSGAKLVFAGNLYAYGPVDGPLREEHSPAEHVRRPAVPAESPALGFTHLQFEALLAAARESSNPCDFALVAMLGLLGLRIFEATGADIGDLGEEHGHRVLRVCGKGTKVVMVPLPPAVGRAIDQAVGTRASGRSC